MLWEKDEEEVVLFLAEPMERGNYSMVSLQDVAAKTGIAESRLHVILGRLYDGTPRLCMLTPNADQVRGEEACIREARAIKARRSRPPAPPDWVVKIEGWATSHPCIALGIVVVKVAGPIVGLVGGILGCIALARS